MPYLEIRKCPVDMNATRLELETGSYTLGRAAGLDISIPDPCISLQHLQIQVNGYRIECSDLGSRNGTYVDGIRITDKRLLKHGQIIRAGGTELEVILVDPEAGMSTVSAPLVSTDSPGRGTRDIQELAGLPIQEVMAPENPESTETTRIRDVSRLVRRMEQWMRDLHGALATEELLERAMALVMETLRSNTGYIILLQPNDRTAISDYVAYLQGRRQDDRISTLHNREVVNGVLDGRRGFLGKLRATPPPAGKNETDAARRGPGVICCPVHADGNLLGALYLEGPSTGAGFTRTDLALAMNLASIVGMVVASTRAIQQIGTQDRSLDHLRRFVSDEVIEKIMRERHDGYPHLQPRRGSVTVLQAEICGFTRLCENLSPAAMSGILNIYYSAMWDVNLRFGGTVDTFVGDRIMVLFNAPFEIADPEGAAVNAALELRKRLHELQPEWERYKIPHFDIGIGITSGPAVVGSVGPNTRLEYAAVGPCVTLASRVCWITKPGQILVTEPVLHKLGDRVVSQPAGNVDLRDRPEGLPVFEIVRHA